MVSMHPKPGMAENSGKMKQEPGWQVNCFDTWAPNQRNLLAGYVHQARLLLSILNLAMKPVFRTAGWLISFCLMGHA